MPTSTFFNLKEEKQQRIIIAAKQEFERVPLYQASISKIVQNAEISRGSFYQYFNGIEDLYSYYFTRIITQLQQSFATQLIDSKGDLFTAERNYFEIYLNSVVKEQHHDFYKNFFLNINLGTEQRARSGGPHFNLYQSELLKESRQAIYGNTDWKLLDVTSEQNKGQLVRLMGMTFFHSIAWFFKTEQDGVKTSKAIEQTLLEFNHSLNWIEFGARTRRDK